MMTCFERIILNKQQRLEEQRKRQMKHEWIKQSISSKKALICFITKKFMKQAERREECDLAESLNTIMYAAVKKGTRWRKFKKYPWRKIYYYGCKEDITAIMSDIFKDISFYRRTGGS